MSRREARLLAFCITLGMFVAEYTYATPVAAQEDAEAAAEATPGTGRIVALRLRQPAPFAGLLIEQDDLVRWRLEIEGLRFQLDAERRRAEAEEAVHQRLFDARLTAAGERLELVQTLWQSRATELRQSLDDALQRAQREVWEHPVLWLAIGLALGVIGTVVAVVAAAGV